MNPLWNTDFLMLLIVPTIQESIDYDKCAHSKSKCKGSGG